MCVTSNQIQFIFMYIYIYVYIYLEPSIRILLCNAMYYHFKIDILEKAWCILMEEMHKNNNLHPITTQMLDSVWEY